VAVRVNQWFGRPMATAFGQATGRWALTLVLGDLAQSYVGCMLGGPFNPWEAERRVLIGWRGVALD
jgi:hypothetical protein